MIFNCLSSCADPGIFARWVHARLPENSPDNVVFGLVCFFQLILQFYSGLSMVYFKENYNFSVQNFPRGVQFLKVGLNPNLYRNP